MSKYLSDKELRGFRCVKGVEETKPICGGVGFQGSGPLTPGPMGLGPRVVAPNEPNFLAGECTITSLYDRTCARLPRRQTGKSKANLRAVSSPECLVGAARVPKRDIPRLGSPPLPAHPEGGHGGRPYTNALRRHYKRGFPAKRSQFAARDRRRLCRDQ